MFINAIEFDNYFRVTYGLSWDDKMKAGIVDLALHIKAFLSVNLAVDKQFLNDIE
jgi:DNA-binding transcriptional MocR family regulator